MKISPGSAAMAALALTYFVACLALRSQQIVWDGYVYLLSARDHYRTDLTHLLYVPSLRAGAELLWPSALPFHEVALLLSCATGAASLWLLSRVLVLLGARQLSAAGVALLAVTSSSFWALAVSIEVYVPAMAAILLACWGALLYRGSRRTDHLLIAVLGFGLGAGYHLAAVLALPALAIAGFGFPPRVPRRQLVLLAVLFATPIAALLGMRMERLLGLIAYPVSLVPSGSEMVNGALPNLATAVSFFWQSSPALLVLAVAGWFAGLRSRPLSWRLGTIWLLPSVAVYCLFGASYFGILLPTLAALSFLVVALAHVVSTWTTSPVSRGLATALLVVLLAHSMLRAVPELRHAATTPDPEREVAEQLADRVAPDVVLFAHNLYHPLAYFTAAPAVSLAEMRRRRSMPYSKGPGLAGMLRFWTELEIAKGRRPFLLEEGRVFLLECGVEDRDLLLDREHAMDLLPRRERTRAYALHADPTAAPWPFVSPLRDAGK